MPDALTEVIAHLGDFVKADRYAVGPTIFAVRPWGPNAPARVLNEDAIGGVAPTAPEYAYLLEVKVAKEVLAVWSAWRGNASPTLAEAVEAVIHYATNDAYLPVQ